MRLETLLDLQDGTAGVTEDEAGVEDADLAARCPQCEETDSIALDKLRPHFNTCYRCRLCGHIFSPAEFRAAS